MESPVYFFTHHKCASAWLSNILVAVSEDLGMSVHNTSNSKEYTGPYQIIHNGNSDYQSLPDTQFRAVHVVRDIRDIVVSGYFSHLNSHPADSWPELQKHKRVLKAIPQDAGMIAEISFLESVFFEGVAVSPLNSILSWNYEDPRILTLRMEDLVSKPEVYLAKAFNFLKLSEVKNLQKIISKFTFEKLSGGRKKGVVDTSNHYRSGIPGDWKHLIPQNAQEYLTQKYRSFLEKFSYEIEI